MSDSVGKQRTATNHEALNKEILKALERKAWKAESYSLWSYKPSCSLQVSLCAHVVQAQADRSSTYVP